jgi:2,6-dihydroxypseudooxynicotine hydrolase
VPDIEITSAIANWGPRFTAQGVDPSDFTRVTGPLERWADWLDAWSANGDQHTGLAREAEEAGRNLTAGEAWIQAALSYHFAKFVWMLDLARHRAAADRAVTAMRHAHRLLDPTAERLELDFEGAMMVGNLRRPPGIDRPPLVVLIAGLDSAKEEFFAAENVFLARGMATFSLDGPGQGETGYTATIRPDFEAPVAAALDVLCARPDLDGNRVGMLGVSLGGYYAARAAAFEPRIRAVVISGGPYDYGALIRHRAPHSFATFAHNSGTTSKEETYEFAARLTLDGVLGRLTQPMVVVFGQQDRLVPWEHAVRVAKEAPDWLAERLAELP